ncbi:DUF3613 domain-containing protein [Dyella caseinilytica]|uniref:DUF3613 domain-containing protein n=1 Tax=Dyella caseinilytica TaxID=1849581 RepID=A0ABX7H220_9GAMM|nr:DUF3613 domain-containing protein [Dyella caseinilytica]QRN55460.1 DUF3613 domain-containing protein [Dyella caseinilytica]GGA01856.1 hypothetical protein GCM10011408_24060 [Dyella caseinilytica]
MKTPHTFVQTLILAVLMPVSALAQQAPNTAPNTPTPGFAPAESAPPFHASQVGDTTRYVLQLQADGTQAGKPLPMLGDEATAAYRRYLKSFEHPIPDFYDTTLSKNSDTVR